MIDSGVLIYVLWHGKLNGNNFETVQHTGLPHLVLQGYQIYILGHKLSLIDLET